MSRVCLVVNPRSGTGRIQAQLQSLRAAGARYSGAAEVWLTERAGHGVELARAASDAGFDRVVAVGGDGTASEVVNGLLTAAPRANAVVFGMVHAGTGGDLVKTLRVPLDLDAAVRVASRGEPVATDAVRLQMQGLNDQSVERYGINVTGFGANGDVVRRANASSKRLGGRVTFLSATIRSLWDYVPQQVRVRGWLDDEPVLEWEGRLQSAFLANGAYCGGGMWVGPNGSMTDGHLELTLIPQMSRMRLARDAYRLFTGTIAAGEGVTSATVQRIEAVAPCGSEVLVEVDGELPGKLPLTAQVVRGAVLVAGVSMH